jgi:hypothetical protein
MALSFPHGSGKKMYGFISGDRISAYMKGNLPKKRQACMSPWQDAKALDSANHE